MTKKKRGSMGTPALRVLEETGIDYRLHEYEHSSHMDQGYAVDSAKVLGFELEEVFKTLMAYADGKPVVGLVPANSMLNVKSLAKAVGAKRAQIMPPEDAERLTGYVTGGISPLGQRAAFPTVIDESALLLETMIVSGGKRSLSIEIAPKDLATLTNSVFAGIADFSRHF